jgi:membrane fusion protein, multidrug efflux system
MRSRTFLILSIVSLLSVAACYRSTTDKPQGSRPAGAPPVPVAVATVTRENVPIYLTGLGNVQAYNTVTVKTRIDGEIMAVYFREGQDVHKGQLLALIDPRPYEVALETAQANLARDQAQQRTAQANLAREKALYEAGVVALQDYQTQQATAGQFDGTVKADQAAIANAKLNLQYTRIISPIDGRVGLRLIDPGNMVHAADTNGMLVVTQLHPIAVIFTLPEQQLPDVLAQSRKAPLVVQAYGSDDQHVLATGRLETVDNQIDPTTGTAKLKAVFDNRDSSLWPNQFVNTHLQLSIARNVLVIPTAAVQRGPEGNLAFVMSAGHKITIQPITVSLTQGNNSVISSGLQAGEQVVTEGQDKLQAGTLVAPRPSAPQNAALPQGSKPPGMQSAMPGANDLHAGSAASGAKTSQAPPHAAENLGGNQ